MTGRARKFGSPAGRVFPGRTHLRVALVAGLVFGLLSCSVACGEADRPPFAPELAEYSQPRGDMPPYFKGADLDPYWPPENAARPAEAVLPELRRLRGIRFEDHTGRARSAEELRGRYTLVYFFFVRCPGICPLLTRNVQQFVERLPDAGELQLLSITVTPELDRPADLRAYRKRYGILRDNWIFLTGQRADIYALARAEFNADVRAGRADGGNADSSNANEPGLPPEGELTAEDLADFVHTENVFLLDREGFLRGAYRARGSGDLDRLRADLAQLRADDSEPATAAR